MPDAGQPYSPTGPAPLAATKAALVPLVEGPASAPAAGLWHVACRQEDVQHRSPNRAACLRHVACLWIAGPARAKKKALPPARLACDQAWFQPCRHPVAGGRVCSSLQNREMRFTHGEQAGVRILSLNNRLVQAIVAVEVQSDGRRVGTVTVLAQKMVRSPRRSGPASCLT